VKVADESVVVRGIFTTTSPGYSEVVEKRPEDVGELCLTMRLGKSGTRSRGWAEAPMSRRRMARIIAMNLRNESAQ